MLEVRNLVKKYGKIVAVKDVGFSLENGTVGILLGPNGAGKSTIIKSIAGLLRFTGDVRIEGMPARDVNAKRVFAYVPEIPAMFEMLTVREHMNYVKQAYALDVTEEEIDALLVRFELRDKQDKLGNELSKGMMQKVSICCALLIKPRVILFDEPMVGLDPMAIKELKNVIGELKSDGVTVLISTHMLEMVEELWDVMFVMEEGTIIGEYTKEDAKGKALDELFFGITGGEEQWRA